MSKSRHGKLQRCKNLGSIWIFLDHFPFSGEFNNCPDFSIAFPLFGTASKLSEFFYIISHFPDGFKTTRISLQCIVLHCIVLHCVVLYCIKAQEHWISILWQCRERQTRVFCREKWFWENLRKKSSYPESFGSLRLWQTEASGHFFTLKSSWIGWSQGWLLVTGQHCGFGKTFWGARVSTTGYEIR